MKRTSLRIYGVLRQAVQELVVSWDWPGQAMWTILWTFHTFLGANDAVSLFCSHALRHVVPMEVEKKLGVAPNERAFGVIEETPGLVFSDIKLVNYCRVNNGVPFFSVHRRKK